VADWQSRLNEQNFSVKKDSASKEGGASYRTLYGVRPTAIRRSSRMETSDTPTRLSARCVGAIQRLAGRPALDRRSRTALSRGPSSGSFASAVSSAQRASNGGFLAPP